MYKICPKIEFVLLMINNIEIVVKRHKKVSLALSDIEGQASILMFLMQIGETLNKIDKDVMKKYDLTTEVSGAYNVRNFIAHDYEGVNLSLVEKILRSNIETLKKKLLHLQQKCK